MDEKNVVKNLMIVAVATFYASLFLNIFSVKLYCGVIYWVSS